MVHAALQRLEIGVETPLMMIWEWGDWKNRDFKRNACFACVLSHSVMSNSLQPLDCSLPGSSVHEIFQARILEWVAISSFRGSSWPKDQTHISCVSCIADGLFTCWVIREALSTPQIDLFLPRSDLSLKLGAQLPLWMKVRGEWTDTHRTKQDNTIGIKITRNEEDGWVSPWFKGGANECRWSHSWMQGKWNCPGTRFLVVPEPTAHKIWN